VAAYSAFWLDVVSSLEVRLKWFNAIILFISNLSLIAKVTQA
jgi:hypothetical protein